MLGRNLVRNLEASFDGVDKVVFVEKWEKGVVEEGLGSEFGYGIGFGGDVGIENVVGGGLADNLRVALVRKEQGVCAMGGVSQCCVHMRPS